MFKFFSSIASLLFGKRLLSIPYEVIVDYAIARIRSMAKSAALGFAGIVLILTGALVAYFNVLATYDLKGVFMMSAVAGGGIGICVLGVLLIAIASYKKSHPEHITRPSDVLTTEMHSPLEQAFANLINEFVENRREKHAAKEAAATGAV